jgi:hypothetical protein
VQWRLCPLPLVSVPQRCAEKAWEELQANRDDEQQYEAERLDLPVGLGQLRPGQRQRQSRARDQHKQQAGAETR